MTGNDLNAYNIADLREMARKRLPKFVFEFVDRGNEDEVALRNNRAAFERIKLKPRMLVDVSRRNQEITLFGKKHMMPIAIGPTGIPGMLWHEGEIALAQAAKDAGISFSLATASITPLEKVVSQVGGTLWFQLYMWADRSLSHQLVKRAWSAGYEALLVTVDGPVSANREYNRRNGYNSALRFNRRNVTDVIKCPHWLFSVLMRYWLTTGMPRRENYPPDLRASIVTKPQLVENDSLTWNDIRTLRDIWPGKLIVKGILHPHDAILAAECGADAVIVSNHGGRNLDSAMAPIEVLPEIVAAVGGRLTVLIDSGFRRGSDVVKALALGAAAVLIGRPALYGTTVAGHAGAARAIEIFREEIDRVMALIGCCSIADLSPEYVQLP